MRIIKTRLGSILQENIYQYQLTNNNNLQVSLLSYGGTITEIAFLDKKNGMQNVVLSLEHWEDYIQNPLYAGANLGPNAGRIQGGKLTIGAQNYILSKNDGNNNLHGGFSPISYANWALANTSQKEGSVSLTLTTILKDGQDGFPGERHIAVTYTLDNSNKLTLQYQATSSKDTYLNLSNHSYFNLSGDFTRSALEQILTIKADSYLENNEEHLPIRLRSVSNGPFDFRVPLSLEKQIKNFPGHSQIAMSKGYNNGFDISNYVGEDKPILSLWNPEHTKGLRMYTDAPCLVLYSGGFIDQSIRANDGQSYASCGIALEAQDFPNTFDDKDSPMPITKSGETYHRTICYEFLY